MKEKIIKKKLINFELNRKKIIRLINYSFTAFNTYLISLSKQFVTKLLLAYHIKSYEKINTFSSRLAFL